MSDGTPTGLVCPKCQGPMLAQERSGVTIEQCRDCRGVFLDKGELERLADAEDAHYGAAPGQPQGYPPQGYPPPMRRRKRSGFLGELLDF